MATEWFHTIKEYSMNTKQHKRDLFVLFSIITALAFAVFAFIPTASSLAQSLPGISSVDLLVSPRSPRPYDTVRLEVRSFSADLDRSTISWYVNGALEQSGIGERVFETRVSKAGDATRVEARVAPSTGSPVIRSITLRPASVDILWHAHTYTPPFYRGKALPASRGLIVFTAIPNLVNSRGIASDPSNIIYTWQQSGITLGGASGYGRKQVVLEGEAVSLQPMNVSVIATSFNETLEAADSVQLRVKSPQIVFYEKHPLEGIRYEKAFGSSFSLAKEEISLRAEPYFFSLDDVANGLLEYTWKVGGKTVELSDEIKNEIVLRKDSSLSGDVDVSLVVVNDNFEKVLQEAGNSFRVNLKDDVRF